MVAKYGIKYFYDITDRADFRANPDYKGVCHIAMAQEGHCLPGESCSCTDSCSSCSRSCLKQPLPIHLFAGLKAEACDNRLSVMPCMQPFVLLDFVNVLLFLTW